MATFEHSDHQTATKTLDVADDGKTLFMNGKRTVSFTFDSAKVRILVEDGTNREYTSSRGVIRAPHGAKVLPYFSKGHIVYVVLVEQFRIALPGKTLEAAGGEVDETNPRESMARELMEEAHIAVKPDDIQVVYAAYIQPSMMASKAFGGVVRIEEQQIPTELLGGEWACNEYTLLVTRPITQVLHDKDSGKVILDLETLLLLQAVLNRTGVMYPVV